MEAKPSSENPADREEAAVSEIPPKRDPKKAAGSLNPREKTAFYEAVVRKAGGRKRTP